MFQTENHIKQDPNQYDKIKNPPNFNINEHFKCVLSTKYILSVSGKKFYKSQCLDLKIVHNVHKQAYIQLAEPDDVHKQVPFITIVTIMMTLLHADKVLISLCSTLTFQNLNCKILKERMNSRAFPSIDVCSKATTQKEN